MEYNRQSTTGLTFDGFMAFLSAKSGDISTDYDRYYVLNLMNVDNKKRDDVKKIFAATN